MRSPAWSLSLPWNEIKQIASHFNLEPNLIAAIIQKESGGDPFAIRYEPNFKYLLEPKIWAKKMRVTEATETQLQKFSFGLCQIMGATARDLEFSGPFALLFEIEENLFYGCKYLADRFGKYKGNKIKAIAAYNAGSPRYNDQGVLVNLPYVHDVLALEKLLS